MTARWGLGFFLAIALLSQVMAQEPPVHGCGQSVNCQPLGYSTITTNPNSVVFGGFRVGPNDFHFYVVTPRAKTPPPDSTSDVRVFHLRNVSLLPPTPTPVPRAAPPSAQVTPSAPNR